jgi:ankyrin repeat protein
MGMVNKNQLYYLHLAARYSNGKLFKLLIDEGYSMDIVDSDNNTVLD